MLMAIYQKPSKKIHRGFAYLDDETVINSLSAVESGKIDEVVAKVNSAREGGFGGGVGIQGAKVEGAKKSTSAFEEEMVRTRTRFSVFELWYQSLIEGKALGHFKGWGPDALAEVKPGDTLEFRAVLEAAPIQTLLRMYLWYVDKAKSQGHVFSMKGEALKELKDTEKTVRMVLGEHANDEDEEIIVLARPLGDPGPTVAMPIKKRWVIGSFGRFGGEYSVVAQVERLIGENEEIPAHRLTQEVAATPLEIEVLKEALAAFESPAQAFGLSTADAATIRGPALWLEPIAIFR